jgi:UDP-N-acetylmuramate: L-alanyl-gamma-D-glutamyl-meso-diaminopimelate ligase
VHIIGICGRATAPLADGLKRMGVEVTGSDAGAFPPMDAFLRSRGIAWNERPTTDSLPRGAVVVCAGGVTPAHPELAAAIDEGREWLSFPAFLERTFLRTSRNFVVAGTNGKTTTTAMLAWLMEAGGLEPDYLIGGLARNFPQAARFHGSVVTVLEGDEYWTGPGDVRPKFLHYRAEVVVVTNLHHDHPEVYPDERSYQFPFKHLVDLLPAKGRLVLNADDPGLDILKPRCRGTVTTVGFSPKAEFRITGWKRTEVGSRFRLDGRDYFLPMWGRMNVLNAALAVVAARVAGVTPARAAKALASFAGVQGRQQVLIEPSGNALGIKVVLDEAYHPQSLAAVLEAVRAHHPRRRVVLVYRPRGCGFVPGSYEERLPAALAGADLVLLADLPAHLRVLAFDQRAAARAARRRGAEVRTAKELTDFLPRLGDWLKPGDVVVVSVFHLDHAFPAAMCSAITSLPAAR